MVDASADRHLPSAKTARARPATWWSGPTAAAHRPRSSELERLGIRPAAGCETAATPEDAALILADAADAAVIVGVGMHATLDEFLDRQRPGLASTYLTRLKVGRRLVDAAAVPTLYSGRVRPGHLLLVMLAGLIALAAAIAVTPVGQEWADDACPTWPDLADNLHGLLRDLVRHHIVSLVARLPRARRRHRPRRWPAQRPRAADAPPGGRATTHRPAGRRADRVVRRRLRRTASAAALYAGG